MVAEIPIDERTGKPLVTSEMKAECIGEFSITEQLTCTSCSYDEAQPDCEVCGGEVTYDQKFTIPWTTCKEIYKRMASVILRQQSLLSNVSA